MTDHLTCHNGRQYDNIGPIVFFWAMRHSDDLVTSQLFVFAMLNTRG